MRQSLMVLSTATSLFAAACGTPEDSLTEGQEQALEAAPNVAGIAESLHLSGAIDRNNPFFSPLGNNPRSCETCHSAAQGWTMNSVSADQLLKDSRGLDPLFNVVDQGTRPDVDVSTYDARVAAFKETTVKRGLTRF